MKKTLLAILCLALASMAYTQDLSFAMNFGVATDKNFKFDPLFLSGGIELDFHLGSYVMISPELIFYTDSKFNSDSMLLAPGAVINFKAGPLYLGGGVTKWIALSSGGGSSDFMLKLNAGLRSGNIRIGGYIVTPFDHFFDWMTIGFFLGFDF